MPKRGVFVGGIVYRVVLYNPKIESPLEAGDEEPRPLPRLKAQE